MKTAKNFSMIMAIVLLSFSIISCDPNPNFRGHTITLHVDTDSINEKNLDSTCNFGQPAGVSNKDFITVVDFGDEITWIGKSSSSDQDKVKIKKIKYESGDKILTKNVKRNTWFTPKVNGRVNSKDKFDETKEELEEKYSIEFKVVRNGKKETFVIDPKLQVIR